MADRVTVIGWDGSPLSEAAHCRPRRGHTRRRAPHTICQLPDVPAGAERIRLGSVDIAARRIARHRGTAVVLADGDPGFFGVVRALRAPEHGLEVEVVPARLRRRRRLRPRRDALGRRAGGGRQLPYAAPRGQRLPRLHQGRRAHLARRRPCRTRAAARTGAPHVRHLRGAGHRRGNR